MKAVLISIQPKWVEKIASGEKTIEVRKTKPKLEKPFKVYIYCTIGNGVKGDYLVPSGIQCGKVIGEFVCDEVVNLWAGYADERGACCLTYDEMENYLGFEENGITNKMGYGWHISNLKIYDKPKKLNEFYARCNIPESKCKLCDNCYDRENYYGRHYAVKKITRPPQSWCYVEE